MSKVLVVCGPTASGKTALAIECAKLLNGEIISADSMLIYKNCDIGSAKPSKEEMQGIAHHMIDVVEPESEYSVSDYEEGALKTLDDVLSRGKTPIICGGTGFYIKSLLFKSHFGCTAKDENLRSYYEDIAKENGVEYLHSLLREKDAASAEKLHPNDVKRVIRALEIYDLTGVKKSDQNDKEEPRFDFKCYQYAYDRAFLYERINKRVDIMFEQGLIEEVSSLIDRGITDENQCMQGIGYKEVYYGLKNNETVYEISERIKKNTRNYAKRQITFFKKLQNITDLSPESAEITAKRIVEDLL